LRKWARAGVASLLAPGGLGILTGKVSEKKKAWA